MAKRTSVKVGKEGSTRSSTKTTPMHKAERAFAFDLWDRVLRIAESNSIDQITVGELAGPDLPAKIQEILENESHLALATGDSRSQIAELERRNVKVEVIPRLLAIYWAFRDQVEDLACLVLSVGSDRTTAGLIIGGSLENQQQETSELSLQGIWRKYLESNNLLKRRIAAYKQKDPSFDEKVFQGFHSAMRTGERVNFGGIFIQPPIDLECSLDAFKNFLQSIDPNRRAKVLILSDWATRYCNLAELFRQSDYTVLNPENEEAFIQASKGLIHYGLSSGQIAKKATKVSPDPWLDRCVRPTLKQDVGRTLDEKNVILKSAGEFGLSMAQAEEAFAKGIKHQAGTTEEVLRTWLSNVDEVLKNGPIGDAESALLLLAAQNVGIFDGIAQEILDKRKSELPQEPRLLCCPNIGCLRLRAEPGDKFCPSCGSNLEEPSIGLWLRKTVPSALDKNVLDALNRKTELLNLATGIGLSSEEAKRAFDSTVRGLVGVSEDELTGWLNKHVWPALADGENTEDLQFQILLEAERVGIVRGIAEKILKQVLPVLEVEPAVLTFDPIKRGARAYREIRLRNIGGGELRGTITTDVPWIEVDPTHLDPGQSNQRVHINIDSSGLEPDCEDSGVITFSTSGGTHSIPVDIRVVEPWLQHYGKLIATGAILLVVVIWAMRLPPPPSPPRNRPPTVSLEVPAPIVEQGKIVELIAHASDPDGDSLTYDWKTTAGRIYGNGSRIVLDTSELPAASSPRSITVTVSVSDNHESVSANQAIEVPPGPVREEPSPSPPPPPALATLFITTNLDGVRIWVDGNPKGVLSRTQRKRFHLPMGQHRITATKEGYKHWEQAVSLTSNVPSSVPIVMEPKLPDKSKSPIEHARENLERTQQLFEEGNLDAAKKECMKGLELDPGNVELEKLSDRIERTIRVLEASSNPPTTNDQHLTREDSPQLPVERRKGPAPEQFVHAAVKRKVRPRYPPLARQRRISGTVRVRVDINEQGKVVSAKAVGGPTLLRQAAVDAAKRWEFHPARRGDQPIKDTRVIAFDFNLRH